MTIRERLIKALKMLGCEEVETKSRHYACFRRPGSTTRWYFVGWGGGLKAAYSPRVMKALTCSPLFRGELLDIADGRAPLELDPRRPS